MSLRFPEFKSLHGYCFATLPFPQFAYFEIYLNTLLFHILRPSNRASLRFSLSHAWNHNFNWTKKNKERNSRGILIIWNFHLVILSIHGEFEISVQWYKLRLMITGEGISIIDIEISSSGLSFAVLPLFMYRYDFSNKFEALK